VVENVLDPNRNEVGDGFPFEHGELVKTIPEHLRDPSMEHA
jgi:hypothetical protein